jgi:heterodisulfide reductase subunit A-like polyferredoxin
MAVAKAAYVEPLHQVGLNVKKAALIVGGGIAGMETALGIARQGCDVYLVEKSDALGGNARKLHVTWQGEPVAPYLEHLIETIESHPMIHVFKNAVPSTTTGCIGNFTTVIHSRETVKPLQTVEHGATILATGGKEYKPSQYLYTQNDCVMTHLDFDAAMHAGDKRIPSANLVVFIQCVGSRTDEHPPCSRVCCTHSLKSAIALKKQNPDMEIFILYRDMRSYGFREDLYTEAREKGVTFIRFDPENPPVVTQDDNKTLTLEVTDPILGRLLRMEPDVLVLAAAVLPNENRELFELFKVPVNAEGFLVEAHAKLRPVDFASEGLFMAGLAHYPKPLDESIAQAQAVVSRAMTILSKDQIMVGGVVADVDPGKCAVCLTCVRACPYNIPYISVEKGHAVIDPAECHGCGVCVSECPGKAITLQHFTDKQIIAKTDALFVEVMQAS